MKLWLALKLIGSEVQVAVRRHGEGVGPENPRIMNDCFPFTIRLHLPNAIVLEVAGVNPPLVVAFKTVRRTLSPKSTTASAIVCSLPERSKRSLVGTE